MVHGGQFSTSLSYKELVMILGIMQPYFFPYIGYFSLIKSVDKWIVFDSVQYIKRGWIERNRILSSNGSPFYIKVPLNKFHRHSLIKDVTIKNTENWSLKMLEQIKSYKKYAPFYHNVYSFLEESFEFKTNSIVEQNVYLLKKTCEYLEIPFNYEVFSEMNLSIDQPKAPGDWALNICKSLRAKEYINPIGGMQLFNKDMFEKSNIKIKFIKSRMVKYYQGPGEFHPWLSILDVMMFNDINKIHEILDNCEFIK